MSLLNDLRHLDSIRDRLIDETGLDEEQLQGLPGVVWQRWEETLGHRLPAAYVEFLALCGAGSGGRFDGSGLTSPRSGHFESQRKEVERCLQLHFGMDLPSDYWVLEEWMGGYFSFFRLDEGDDPPVYEWFEGEETFEFTQRTASFTEYLGQRLDEWSHYARRRADETRPSKEAASQPDRAERPGLSALAVAFWRRWIDRRARRR